MFTTSIAFPGRHWLLNLTITVTSALLVTACGSIQRDGPAGHAQCERFFIYDLCVADVDRDGRVDYMYFDDTREIFMFAADRRTELRDVMPFHRCAIPMSASTREYSSQLLYGEELGLRERMQLKGRLISNYRASQPAVDACNREQRDTPAPGFDDPFLVQEDWDEGP